MKIEFLKKAKENFTAARICFDNELYNACANRDYTDEDVSKQKADRRLSMAKELLEIVEKEIVR